VGLVVAGVCFIVPAMLLVWLIAWMYVRYGTRVEVAAMLRTMQPVVLAVVVQAIVRLGKGALRTRLSWVIAVVSVVALLTGVHELLVLVVAAAVTFFVRRVFATGSVWGVLLPVADAGLMQLRAVQAAAATAVTNGGILLSFGKIGSVLFGSGYVLLAFLRQEFVERRAWLSEAQVIDAITIGQVTPGPVFTSATFVGYVLNGNAGAAVATVGIFLPAFLFVALTAPIVRQLREWEGGAALLEGLNAASLAMMASVVLVLSSSVMQSWTIVLIFLVSAALLLWTRVSTALLLVAAAALGALLELA
jgi:chromate transporter